MGIKTKKATFNLHTEVIEALDRALAEGVALSKNALVEKALLKEFKELKRQTRNKLWQEALKDPLFLKDIEDVESDFYYADAENAGILTDD